MPQRLVQTAHLEARSPFRQHVQHTDQIALTAVRTNQHLLPTVSPMPAPSPVGLKLLGTIIHGNDRMALVGSESRRYASYVQEGQGVGQWEVAEIQADHIVLKFGPTKATLLLRSIPPPIAQMPGLSLYSPDNSRPTLGKWPR